MLFLFCGILLSSCSMTVEQIFLLPVDTATPVATSTLTSTDVPSSTPTIPTPTFTLTPTLAGQRTQTPTPDYTPTPGTITPLALFTPNTPTSAVKMRGFVTAFTSEKEFFRAGECVPTTVKFTAQVANPAATAFVQLFLRFKSRQSGATSEWTSITMQSIGGGTFIHDLKAEEMKGVDFFRNSWVQYQFVATDSGINEIGRTDIFDERLRLLECIPTPVPSESAVPSAPSP